MKPSIVGIAALNLLFVSCSSPVETKPFSRALSFEDALPTSEPYVRRLARISHYGDPVEFTVPETGQVGVPIEAQIRLYSGGCIVNDTIFTSVEGLNAEILPMQRVPSKPTVCTMELRVSSRTVSVVFDRPGTARVRVTGRAAPGDSLVAVTRRIEIARAP